MNSQDLIDLIDRAYVEAPQNRCPIRGSALGKCPRELAALLRGADARAIEPRSRRILELGTLRGDALAKRILGIHHVGIGRLPVPEYEVWIPLPITSDPSRAIEALAKRYGAEDLPVTREGERLLVRGRIDLVMPTLGGHVLVEFKTKSSYGFEKLDEEGIGYEYLVQALAYREGFVYGPTKVLTEPHQLKQFVVFENKDTSELKAIEVRPEEHAGVLEAALANVASVLDGWIAGVPIEETVALHAQGIGDAGGKLPWQCNYCSVGPVAGRCVPQNRLFDARRKGADIPKWEVKSR